jgi:outer membrane receptor protein involved in Fe transport
LYRCNLPGYFVENFAEKMKKTLILLLIVLTGHSLVAQPGPSRASDNTLATGTIKGKVVEASSGTAVEYATVTLYTAGDSTMVDGMISDNNGEFEFKKVPEGEYRVIVRFMGFRKIMVEGVSITSDNQMSDLGTLSLRPDVANLEEVEIKAEKALVEYKIDRKVVNVEQQIQAQGGTAVDVLERIPSIKTDLEGNVELRGSSSFMVLIDGKPSILTGSDALDQIPASTIEQIEIITNPSAKYDPDGTAGIINVITKKNALKGLSGIISLSGSNSPDYSGNIMLNYRTKKTSISFSADYSNRMGPGNRYSLRESYKGDTIDFLQTNSEMEWGREGITLRGGVDHSITSLNTITAEASYRYHKRSRNSYTRNSSWSNYDPIYQNYITDAIDGSTHPTLQFTLMDVQKFKREGTELSMRLTYNQGDDEGEESTLQYYVDDDWKEMGQVIVDYMNLTTEMEKEWRGDLDFQHSFNNESKLEAGFQLRMDRNEEVYDYFNRDTLGDWILDTVQSNLYNFNHDIYALYGTYAAEFGKLGLKAGLRAEYTDRNLEQLTGGNDYPYEKFDLYPSAYLTYYLPYNQQMQASYSKRVRRPRGHMLNPYPLFSDAFTSFSGNPELEPEFSHSMELNYQKYFGYSFITLEAYYRLTNNKMTRVMDLTDEGVLEMTMQNIDNDRALGIEANANIKLTDWLTINPVATVYDYRLTETTSEEEINKRSTNWDASLELAANLNTGTRLRLNGNYDSPSVTVDGTRVGTFYMGFAARQDFFDNNLSVTLSIRDILDSRRRKGTSEGTNFYTYNEMWRKAPIVSLSVSYKWNNYKRQRGGMDDFNGDFDVINMGDF